MDGKDIIREPEKEIEFDLTQAEADALLIGLRDAGEVNAFRLQDLNERKLKGTLTEEEQDMLYLSQSLNETYIELFERLKEEYHMFEEFKQDEQKIVIAKPSWKNGK